MTNIEIEKYAFLILKKKIFLLLNLILNISLFTLPKWAGGAGIKLESKRPEQKQTNKCIFSSQYKTNHYHCEFLEKN